MEIPIFLLFLGAFQFGKCTSCTQSRAGNSICRFYNQMKCFPEDLYPLVKVKWVDKSVNVYQVESFLDMPLYFVEFRESQQRSSSLIKLNMGNLSSFTSYNQDVSNLQADLSLEKSAGTISEFLRNQEKTDMLKLMHIAEDKEFYKDQDLFSHWSLTLKYAEVFFSKELLTNCNFTELLQPVHAGCLFKIVATFPLNFDNPRWFIDGKIKRSPAGGTALIRLAKTTLKSKDSLLIEIKWETLHENHSSISIVVFLGTQPYLSFKLELTSTNKASVNLKIDIGSLMFDWRILSYWKVEFNRNGKTVSSSTEANYYADPITDAIKYLFEMTENNSSSDILELRHNISSPLYNFEGNMTVHLRTTENSDALVVTEITQRVHTPLDENLRLDLKQITQQCGHWNWETVVMKSGLLDMYVSAQWNHSIFDYYKKRFYFHSHDEEYFSSFDLTINYSKRLLFEHHILLPFLARSYDIVIKYSTDESIFPDYGELLFRDEFQTNVSRSIALLTLVNKDGIWNFSTSTDWSVLESTTTPALHQVKKLMAWSRDENHPINLILKPVLGQPTLSSTFFKVLKWITNAATDRMRKPCGGHMKNYSQ